MNRTLISLLLISTVCATPAFANYFSNPRMGTSLNIGSAPNPRPKPVIVQAYKPVPSTVYITATIEPAVAAPVETVAPILAVVEAPPPALPPAIRRYVIFFDFDKSDLTAEAKQVVAVAVRTAKETGMVRVVVTGHTDTVGSQRYNQALSERRAAAAKMEIVRLGLDARDISTVGRSFSEPLVSTGPGVREPQNRRATIELGYNLTATLVPNAE
jgi:outer membrane protein OmpA-like peptidoglycan-associated protein